MYLNTLLSLIYFVWWCQCNCVKRTIFDNFRIITSEQTKRPHFWHSCSSFTLSSNIDNFCNHKRKILSFYLIRWLNIGWKSGNINQLCGLRPDPNCLYKRASLNYCLYWKINIRQVSTQLTQWVEITLI